MMGLILQSRALEAGYALAAAAACVAVMWKTIEYIAATRRDSRERNQGADPDA